MTLKYTQGACSGRQWRETALEKTVRFCDDTIVALPTYVAFGIDFELV